MKVFIDIFVIVWVVLIVVFVIEEVVVIVVVIEVNWVFFVIFFFEWFWEWSWVYIMWFWVRVEVVVVSVFCVLVCVKLRCLLLLRIWFLVVWEFFVIFELDLVVGVWLYVINSCFEGVIFVFCVKLLFLKLSFFLFDEGFFGDENFFGECNLFFIVFLVVSRFVVFENGDILVFVFWKVYDIFGKFDFVGMLLMYRFLYCLFWVLCGILIGLKSMDLVFVKLK